MGRMLAQGLPPPVPPESIFHISLHKFSIISVPPAKVTFQLQELAYFLERAACTRPFGDNQT